MPAIVAAGQQTKDKTMQRYGQWLRASAGEALRTILPLRVLPESLRHAAADEPVLLKRAESRNGSGKEIEMYGTHGISVHVPKERWQAITDSVDDFLSETSYRQKRSEHRKLLKKVCSNALDMAKAVLILAGADAVITFTSAFSIRQVLGDRVFIVFGLATLFFYWVYFAAAGIMARQKKREDAELYAAYNRWRAQKALLRGYGVPDVA